MILGKQLVSLAVWYTVYVVDGSKNYQFTLLSGIKLRKCLKCVVPRSFTLTVVGKRSKAGDCFGIFITPICELLYVDDFLYLVRA